MCQISAYQFVLQVFGVFGLTALVGLLVCYGAEWIGLMWRDATKGEQK